MIIDTSQIDNVALNLRAVCANPTTEMLESLPIMVDLLNMKARATILGEVAVDSCVAVGLENPKQVKPSQIFSDGEASFLGRFASIELVDFTAALERGNILSANLTPGQELITQGFIFETIPELDDTFEGNLGVASLMRYLAILPGSLYQITRLSL